MQIRLRQQSKHLEGLVRDNPDVQFCYSMLNRVSRSFALVIQQLPEQLRNPVCIFYLVLRALDTVEDDMALPLERKLPLLHTFNEKISDEYVFYACPACFRDHVEVRQSRPSCSGRHCVDAVPSSGV